MIYEIRTYIPVNGRADAMRARFLNHVAKEFFPKYGIELVAVFTPQDVSDRRLIYITRFSNEGRGTERLPGRRFPAIRIGPRSKRRAKPKALCSSHNRSTF